MRLRGGSGDPFFSRCVGGVGSFRAFPFVNPRDPGCDHFQWSYPGLTYGIPSGCVQGGRVSPGIYSKHGPWMGRCGPVGARGIKANLGWGGAAPLARAGSRPTPEGWCGPRWGARDQGRPRKGGAARVGARGIKADPGRVVRPPLARAGSRPTPEGWCGPRWRARDQGQGRKGADSACPNAGTHTAMWGPPFI
ncbi:hypothetical protein APED_11150 [Acanthopleuribacter pedis]